MISFRSARKLSSYLVRTKRYPLEWTVGSIQYKGKRCQTCHNVKEAENFTSITTGKTFKINHKLNCNGKSLVYLLTSSVCLKQYVGQTVEKFRCRWNNYKDNGRKYQEYGTCMQQYLFEHFSEEGHHGFLEDVSIELTDKTDPSNPLQRENYWRSFLKTMAPWGLSDEDCVWNSIYFILTTGFVRIVIRTWFTETILVPIINVPTFITIIAVPVFMTFL